MLCFFLMLRRAHADSQSAYFADLLFL